MKRYVEFYDCHGVDAVDQMNDFIAENESLNVSVVAYRVVGHEQDGRDRTYILAEVEE